MALVYGYEKVPDLHAALVTFLDLSNRLADALRTGPQIRHRLQLCGNLAHGISR